MAWESKHKEHYPVCCACQMKIGAPLPPHRGSLLGKSAISFRGGTCMVWSAGIGADAHHNVSSLPTLLHSKVKGQGSPEIYSLSIL